MQQRENAGFEFVYLCDVVAAELFSAAAAPNRAPIPRHGMWGQLPGPWVPRFPKRGHEAGANGGVDSNGGLS
jgi:hypothetical protein